LDCWAPKPTNAANCSPAPRAQVCSGKAVGSAATGARLRSQRWNDESTAQAAMPLTRVSNRAANPVRSRAPIGRVRAWTISAILAPSASLAYPNGRLPRLLKVRSKDERYRFQRMRQRAEQPITHCACGDRGLGPTPTSDPALLMYCDCTATAGPVGPV
jgi:hypothetical protein